MDAAAPRALGREHGLQLLETSLGGGVHGVHVRRLLLGQHFCLLCGPVKDSEGDAHPPVVYHLVLGMGYG